MKINLKEFKKACELVESYARQIGPNCEIIFRNSDLEGLPNGVQVAPLDWSGDVFEDDLFKALTRAMKEK